jgi:two-component system, LytTR family, sensor kinase
MATMKLPSLQAIARAYALSIAFWCGFALLMGLQYKPFDQLHPWTWLVDLIFEIALRGFALAFWTPPIFYLVANFLGGSTNRPRYVLLWSMGAIPFVFLHTSIIWLLVRPYDSARHLYLARSFQYWKEMLRGGFADEIFIYVAIVVAAHAYEYLKRLRRQERDHYEYQQALAASELQALKMQLHPHFLFNTLHGIATLVSNDPSNAQAMIIKLSNLLRTSLDRSTSDLISFQEELAFAKDYLDLEKMRFGERLTIRWLVAPQARTLLVPQMMLQPLVENAIRHGIASAREGGWIEIESIISAGVLNIYVRNSVWGNSVNGTGVGLRNAEARLKYLYSGDASLKFEMLANRTAVVTLSLPAFHSQFERAQGSKNPGSVKETVCEFSSSMTNL